MRAKFALAACLILCPWISSQETICPADYYPLTVGAEWQYRDEDGATTTNRVRSIETGLCVVEDDTGLRTYWSSDAEGLKVHKFYLPDEEPDFQWSYLEPPITRFPHEMQANREYEDRSLLSNPGLPGTTAVQYKATFEGIQDRAVGGRTYPLCVRMKTRDATVSSVFGQAIMTTVIETTEWWAWGIGPVEQQWHIVIWDIISGQTEEWITLELLKSNLIEDNPPVVQVTQPTIAPVCGTDAGSITISGIASDELRVMKIAWQDNHGHAGLADINDEDWQIADIPLSHGENVITLTVWDSCGNTSTDVFTVFRISITGFSPALSHQGEQLKGIQLTGSGFPENAVVRLRHNDETIVATNVQVGSGGALLELDLDFQDFEACSWDLIIKHSSGVELARLPVAFQTFPLSVTRIGWTPGSRIALSWTSIVDRDYQVWVASGMNEQWELAASVPSQGEFTDWEDVSAQDARVRFYRILPVPFQ